MNYKKLFYLLLIIPTLFVYSACSSDDDPVTPPAINEAEELAKYLDNMNILDQYPKQIAATDVWTGLQSGGNQVVLDIRSASDFANIGHIEGALNVAFKDLVTYYKSNNLASKEKVIIACYSGQTAGYAVGLLRMLGYSNVYNLGWGMTSWNAACDVWSGKVGNGKATQFVTTAASKNAAGSLPVLNTGKTTPQEILEARVNAILADGNPFDGVKISNDEVFQSLSSCYLVNYWSLDHYNTGHIPGAIQYTPKEDLKFSTTLKTLPTDKKVVVYCYSGQTSAHVAAYLKVLGYDAKTLLYGCNAMNYDNMPGTKFTSSMINDFPLVK